jgi:hypothetical protein
MISSNKYVQPTGIKVTPQFYDVSDKDQKRGSINKKRVAK